MSVEDRLGKEENEKRKNCWKVWERGGGEGKSGESGFVGLWRVRRENGFDSIAVYYVFEYDYVLWLAIRVDFCEFVLSKSYWKWFNER